MNLVEKLDIMIIRIMVDLIFRLIPIRIIIQIQLIIRVSMEVEYQDYIHRHLDRR